MMNRAMMALFPIMLLLGSCANKKENVITPAQRQARLDSVLKLQHAEIREMEAQALRDRLSIEVKEKTDSIMAERQKSRVVNIPVPQEVVVPADTNSKPIDTTLKQ